MKMSLFDLLKVAYISSILYKYSPRYRTWRWLAERLRYELEVEQLVNATVTIRRHNICTWISIGT